MAEVTDLDLAEKLSARKNNKIYLKREDLQSVHSFKLRGAYNKMAGLSDEQKKAGVLAASAGNHAQGVAISAKKLGIKAIIVMPVTTPEIKINAVKSYGAEVVLYGDSYSDAAKYAKELVAQKNMVFVHAFDDLEVIAGQGTVGKEILEQLPEVQYIFVPVGGGGLISGVAAYAKSIKPDCKVIGVEPEDSDVMFQSIKAGQIIELDHVGIFADGVAVKRPGDNTFKLAQKYVDDIIIVSTDQICAAIKDIYEDTRSIVEPAGALGVAGAKKYFRKNGLTDNIAVAINSGANMTFERLQFIAERTLLGSGKEALYAIDLPERPGALRDLVNKVVNGYSISEFNYRKQDLGKAHIFVGILLPEIEEKIKFEKAMTANDFKFSDMTNEEISKQHLRHMIGGKAPEGTNETLFEFIFPERPGALLEFLDCLRTEHNISLFHYRNNGGDVAKIMIGIENVDDKPLELPDGFYYEKVDNKNLDLFI